MPFSMGENALNEMFSKFGEVDSINVVIDRETNRPRGFAFVEMEDAGARQAIATLSGQEVDGRALKVNEAKSRENRGGRNNGGSRW